ncbi:portal protein, partial [bacterium]|nr:portal protein [bacterium]
MANKEKSLFKRLTQLFRSGPSVNRGVKKYKSLTKNSPFDSFKRNQSGVYSHTMSAYGSYDRSARYADFSEMEYMPEIASALDIYSEESTACDEKGRVLHIYSENPQIQKILEEVFYDIVNVDFNLSSWVRTLCKYGDFFLFNDVDPETGVTNVYPIPVNEIEREEGFDPEDPMAVRFRWLTQGNTILENWQISHFRLLGNDAFLPYGSSVLEAARRIWRQLILIEDAMLVYRVIRSPERRVFYIDVGNVPPEEVPNYMEQVQTTLKRSQVVDKQTGRVDLRYNPLSVDEDYFLPVRGTDTGTKIDTLAGGSNQNDINDVEYIQKKLFAALKIPKAYLGYEESLSSKATLAQEDIRFSRSIARIQRTIIAELNKLAIITLYVRGYDGDDLIDFDLQLSNPSTIAQQQKLELFRARLEIAGTAPEGMVDKRWIRKHIIGLTDEAIKEIEQGRELDKKRELELESIQPPGSGEEQSGGGSAPGGVFGAPGGDIFGGGEEEEDPAGEEEPAAGEDDAGTETAGYTPRSNSLLTAIDGSGDYYNENDSEDDDLLIDEDDDDEDEEKPVKPSSKVKKKDRKRTPAHLREPV